MFKFGRKIKEKKEKRRYRVDTENLAVPEIHIGEAKEEKGETKEEEDSIAYSEVAIPEIHVRRNRKKK